MDTPLMRAAVPQPSPPSTWRLRPQRPQARHDGLRHHLHRGPDRHQDPGFDGDCATPKAFCECVAGKLVENKSSQADVEMLTKLHNEEISNSDAETHPNFENLLVANEGYEDACRQSLGLSTDYGTDIEEAPTAEGGAERRGARRRGPARGIPA